ncbi:MAG: Imm42 family immunity protein [Pseudomonadota bacterium]
MIIGNKDRLAISWEIIECVDTWIFGRFYLFINGFIVGDPNDNSVDMKGCLNWINNFLEFETNRFEPNLYEMQKEQIFLLLAASVLINEDKHNFCHVQASK